MYSNLPNLIIGFHGCDLTTYENVLYKHERLRASHNSYDWLGNGIYFWENSLDRAGEWAVSYCNRYNKRNLDEKSKEPAVIERIHQYNRENNLRPYDSVYLVKGRTYLSVIVRCLGMAILSKSTLIINKGFTPQLPIDIIKVPK